MSDNFEVVISGGGIVGLMLANLLAKSGLTLALLEQKPIQPWQPDESDLRVSAISHANQQLFLDLDVWDFMCQKRVSPFTRMQIWDGHGEGVIQFDAKEIARDNMGYIIENRVMQTSLLEKLHSYPQVKLIYSTQIESFAADSNGITIQTTANQVLRSQLLVAADGAQSQVRTLAGIEVEKKPYHQTALVAQVHVSLPHQTTAYQKFLAKGPLAFLPLADLNECSIVWSTLPDDAEHLMQMDDHTFSHELNNVFGKQLGEIKVMSKRLSFPLQRQHAKHYVKPFIAAVGDAIHTIHPLAGQGVNLGIQDADELARVILQAKQKQRAIGSYANLRRYERARLGPNLAMLNVVGGIKSIFTQQTQPVPLLRNLALNIGNRVSFIKNCCMCYAMGIL